MDALDKCRIYRDKEEMKMVLQTMVQPSHAVLFVVEAPSSKVRVLLELLELVSQVRQSLGTNKVCIVIPTGPRLSLANAVMNRCELLWSWSIMGVSQSTVFCKCINPKLKFSCLPRNPPARQAAANSSPPPFP